MSVSYEVRLVYARVGRWVEIFNYAASAADIIERQMIL